MLCCSALQCVAVRCSALPGVADKSQFGIYGFAVTFASIVEPARDLRVQETAFCDERKRESQFVRESS